MSDSSKVYDIETYIAEIYDEIENFTDDVLLIKKLIHNKKMNILEPFCGTGRITLSLANDGHKIVGIDNAKGMIDWYKRKLKSASSPIENVELIQENVLNYEWPVGFDLVILGGNCFYELASQEEQELCIEKAYKSLNAEGYIYVDNDHMEGDLDSSWQEEGVVRKSLCGTTQDGSIVETTRKTIWYDIKNRLAKFERKAKITKKTGEIIESMYIQQKHPVSTYEVQSWLEKHGFKIINKYGDWNGKTYTEDSKRAIFWAQKKG
ncbi:class I SAM-dependent methyltransferase [Brassicibacter mesophilus]|uniref:class I SAM-dependent methyltransferase n=1 Tax=Brassicibacter mesophilus TaxID=745119 RepID=UPI003D1ABFD5